MWLQNLKELKRRTGLSSKQIADKENLPERTVSRIFSGDTDNPGVDTIRRIIHALGGSWDEIFAESGAVIGSQDLVTLQKEVERLNAELTLTRTENTMLRDRIEGYRDKIDSLKDEIIETHKYYTRL